MSPHSVVRRSSDGRVSHLVLARTEQDDDGNWKRRKNIKDDNGTEDLDDKK